MNKYSIKEISEMAGVSTATISRYLNKNGYVNKDTSDKIEAVLEKIDYNPEQRKRKQTPRPNRVTNYKIAMISNASEENMQSHTGQLMLSGASETFQKNNIEFSVELINSPDYTPNLLINNACNGVLYHGKTPSDAICEYLKKIPTICLLQQGDLESGGRIMPDHFHSGEITLNYFKQNGVKNVCCIKFPSKTDYSSYRCEGFIKAAKENGIKCTVYESKYPNNADATIGDQMENTKEIVDKLLSQKEFPGGIFVTNNYSGFIHNLLQSKGKIPMKDFLMVASDSGECPSYLFPEPAKLNIFPKEIGILAAEALIMKINNPNTPYFTTLVKPEVIVPE